MQVIVKNICNIWIIEYCLSIGIYFQRYLDTLSGEILSGESDEFFEKWRKFRE